MGPSPQHLPSCCLEHWAALAAQGAQAGASTTRPAPSPECAAAYEAQSEGLFAATGATIRASQADTDDWLERVFNQAENHVAQCWAMRGRFWELSLLAAEYVADLDGDSSGNCSDCWAAIASHTPQLLSLARIPRLHVAACAPQPCLCDEIAAVVLPRYLGRQLGVATPGIALPAPRARDVEVRQLSHWSRLPLDFAIVGADRCGTNSLRRNLNKHPDVDVRRGNFFLRHSNVLPYEDEVAELRGAFTESTRRGALRGFSDPILYRHGRTRQALSRIPNLTALAIVCDPLGRFEKIFWKFHSCCQDGRSPRAGKPCLGSLSSLLEGLPALAADAAGPAAEGGRWQGHGGWEAEWSVGGHLLEVLRLFGRRAKILHQASLRGDPRRTFISLALHLGITPAPYVAAEDEEGGGGGRGEEDEEAEAAARPGHPRIVLRRYNSERGHRTDLCRNATLLQEFQRRFAPEYRAVEEALRHAGVEVPPELRLRRTRCHRDEEVAGPAKPLPGC